jgi:hypothetical protein
VAEHSKKQILWKTLTRDTYCETGDPARLLVQLAGRRGQMNWNSVQREKNFCTVPTRVANAEEKSLVPSPTNKQRKDPVHMYSLSPDVPQF